uniref:Uncharacterized protein n=1 Tax=Anguilla anguilla TaxID=7936 RepID=A0A0E9VMS2_ANGAN
MRHLRCHLSTPMDRSIFTTNTILNMRSSSTSSSFSSLLK